MAYCVECGAELNAESKFCHACGTPSVAFGGVNPQQSSVVAAAMPEDNIFLNWVKVFFWPKGEISRKTFTIAIIMFSLLYLCLGLLSNSAPPLLLFALVLFLCIWLFFCIWVKRLKAMGHSRWSIISVLGLMILIEGLLTLVFIELFGDSVGVLINILVAVLLLLFYIGLERLLASQSWTIPFAKVLNFLMIIGVVLGLSLMFYLSQNLETKFDSVSDEILNAKPQ